MSIQKRCENCGQYFRPPSVSDLNWRFWSELQRPNVSDRLRQSVVDGANINIVMYRETGLMQVVRRGNPDMVRFLCARPELDINLIGRTNTTALLIAARYRSDILATLLAVPNINIDCRTLAPGLQGMTPLMIAVYFNKQENVRLLLRKGVNLTLVDNRGYTAATLPINTYIHQRGAQNVLRAWYHRMSSVVNRLRYNTRQKRRRREKCLAGYIAVNKNIPGDIENIIKGNLDYKLQQLRF